VLKVMYQSFINVLLIGDVVGWISLEVVMTVAKVKLLRYQI
jgi:hypothetical protein